MAEINILNIQPHKISRDMRGFSVLIYGEPKIGKTTAACRFPKNLLLAAEVGYNAIPGAMVQPITTWGDFKKVLKQLKQPEAQQAFYTITLDTVDLFYDFCTRFILQQNGVDKLSDIPYGQGYGLVAKEFDDCLRQILQLGYGLVMISHSTDKVFKDETGTEFNKIVPTLDKRARLVTSRMADIYGYARAVQLEDGTTVPKLFLRGTPRFEAGSRFPYIPDYIDFNYNALVNAIHDCVDKQMAENDKDLFAEKRDNLYAENATTYDFDGLMSEFSSIIESLVGNNTEEEFETNWAPRVQEVVEKVLGKGKKVNQMTRDQAELLSIIVDELNDIIKK